MAVPVRARATTKSACGESENSESTTYWQEHDPLPQDSPGAQALPQEPQLRLSLARSVHAPPHSVEQVTHAPLVQTALARQAWPHEPQLASSAVRSTHAPPHSVAQATQALLVQTSLARQAWPHEPQLALSAAR